jgi:hypothetical protein
VTATLIQAAFCLRTKLHREFGVTLDFQVLLNLLTGACERGEFDDNGYLEPSDDLIMECMCAIHRARSGAPVQ